MTHHSVTPDECPPAGPPALVLVDIQNEFVDPQGRFSTGGFSGFETPSMLAEFLGKVNDLARAFRARARPVFHVITEIRPDYLDSALAPVWAPLGFSAEGGLMTPGSWGAQPPGALVIAPEDFVLVKKGHSAFRGTTMDRTLQALDCHHIVMAGGAIGGCLLDTAYDGAALGYRVSAVRDACFPLQRVDGFADDAVTDVVSMASVLDDLSAVEHVSQRATAVVVLDADDRVMGHGGIASGLGATSVHLQAAGAGAARVVAAANAAGTPVIWVTTEVSSPPLSAFPLTASGASDLADFLQAGPLDPADKHSVGITKTGPSAFFGTVLDRTLRNLGVSRLVLVGGDSRPDRTVVATVRDAAALGFEVSVVGDSTYPAVVVSLGDADRRCTVIDVERAVAELAETDDARPSTVCSP